jgi:hypothetical protein
MKTSLQDLNGHLFDQLARLSAEGANEETVLTEIHRTTGMAHTAERVIRNAQLVIKAQQLGQPVDPGQFELNNILFLAIERLSDDELTAEEITTEVDRAQSVNQLADCVTANNALFIKARELARSGLSQLSADKTGHLLCLEDSNRG